MYNEPSWIEIRDFKDLEAVSRNDENDENSLSLGY
jgi:hypothetical protein